MADFEIERPSVELNQVNPTFNVNPPQFTIEIHGSIQGQRGEKGDKGDAGEPGRDGIDGINGIDGVDGEDGVGVESIIQTSTSHESGGTNIITATLTDGTETTFEIMNGEADSAAAEIIDISDEINYIGAQYQPPAEPPQGLWGVKGITDSTIIGKLNTLKQKILAGEITDFVFYHNPSYNYWGPYHSECYFHINNIAFYEDDYVTLVISCSFDWENGMAHNINDTVEVHYNGSEDSWSVYFYRKDIQNILESEINTKQNKIDSSHKLSSDLVDDTNKTNKFVTASEKTTWGGKQDALVSGTNIKTINNESLLGSGNISIQGGGTGTDVQINGSSIVSNDVADIQVEGTYNASTNKIATMSEIPTKVSDLSNDSGFITNTVNNLTNYYTKTNTYTKTEIDNLISAISTLDIEVVQTLPTQDISTTTIYLVPKTPSTNDAYDEYIYVNNSWEHIGSTEVDLTNYYTKTQTDGLLNNKANTTDVQNNKNLTRGIEYIVGTQAESTNLWTGVSTDTGCSSGTIYTGKTIIYHLPQAGTSSAAKLNLTLPDGTTTGAINIYRLTNSTVTTTFGAGCDILMVFDGTQWKVNAYVDTNTNTIGYQLRTNSGIFKNGASTAIYRYQILVETPNGLEAFTSTSNKTSATKTQLSPHYRPGGEIRYYGATGTVNSGANIGATSLWQQYALDLRYSFNVTNTEFEIGDSIYIKMSKNGDGTLSPVYNAESAGHPLVTELPSTEDGYVYLYLGQTYSAYQMELTPNHPMYEYKNGKIREYTEATSGGGGGTATDVQINGTSITSEGVANILTETAYSSLNKIATVSDLPTNTSDLTNDSGFITSSYHDSTKQDLITSSNKLDYSLVDNTPTIPTVPTNVSAFTNDSEYITGLVMLTYDSSTWQDFQNAYNSNKIVYCKVGGRMAFLAYVEASKVEFQYYRSLSSPTISSQPDEVYVYSLTSAGVWSTTTRKASSTIAVGTGLSRSYTASSRTMTLSVDTSTMAQKSDLPTKTSDLTNDSGFITGYTETDPVFVASAAHGITSTDITNWNNKSNFSGNYNDLTNKPTIPTVNNATLTIQKNGTTVKTFTANASSNVTANITVPTKTSDITNDSGYITGITSSDIYNVLGYYPAAEPNIYVYNSIIQITSTSNQTYIDLMDDITNNRPIIIKLGTTEYVNALGTNNGTTTSLWYMTSDNSYTKITLTVSGTSVTVTHETIEIPTITLSTTTWIDNLF